MSEFPTTQHMLDLSRQLKMDAEDYGRIMQLSVQLEPLGGYYNMKEKGRARQKQVYEDNKAKLRTAMKEINGIVAEYDPEIPVFVNPNQYEHAADDYFYWFEWMTPTTYRIATEQREGRLEARRKGVEYVPPKKQNQTESAFADLASIFKRKKK